MEAKKPSERARTPKYIFQIKPEPISVICRQTEKSFFGRALGPNPTDLSPYSLIISKQVIK
tara:strand:- start:953 stop:1135 length:183 start_codon:yes stop_codon:yes gene_type:complete